MANGLLALESPWEHGLRSRLSVGPFLEGLGASLDVEVVSRQFNGKDDLKYYLKEFRRERAFRTCYIATHSQTGRLDPMLGRLNLATLIRAAGSTPGKGFFIASCEIGRQRNAVRFLRSTKAAFVAGYRYSVPWEEAMVCDLIFLTYLLSGRTKHAKVGRQVRFLQTKSDFRRQSSADPLKIGQWVQEDYRLAEQLGFGVFRRSRRRRSPQILGLSAIQSASEGS